MYYLIGNSKLRSGQLFALKVTSHTKTWRQSTLEGYITTAVVTFLKNKSFLRRRGESARERQNLLLGHAYLATACTNSCSFVLQRQTLIILNYFKITGFL